MENLPARKKITGSSMMKWTREIVAPKRQVIMEENTSQRTRHFEEYSHSVNNLSLQEQMSTSNQIRNKEKTKLYEQNQNYS